MSDDKVVGLHGKVVEPSFDSGVVSVVEDIYHQAKSGKVSGIAVVLLVDDDQGHTVTSSWHGPRMSLLGALARITHKINNSLDADVEKSNG